MLEKIINHHRVREVIDALPGDNRALSVIRVAAKALLFHRRIYAGERVAWKGEDDTVCEKFLVLGPSGSEVLIAAAYTAVSPGTERSYYLNLPNFTVTYPHVPGYSGSGRVLTVGKEVRDFIPGDRVAGVMKHASLTLAPRSSLARIPAGVDPRAASLATLGVIALTAVRETRLRPGQTVAVIGQGIIGQLAVALARAVGGGRVIAVARTGAKRELSLASGADEFFSLEERKGDLSSLSAEAVVEASGSPAALSTAFALCRPGGRVVLAGSSAGDYEGVDLARELNERRITLVGAHVRNVAPLPEMPGSYRREAETFLGLLARGRIRIGHLLPENRSPSEADQFYRALARGEASPLGAIMDWTRPPAPRKPRSWREEEKGKPSRPPAPPAAKKLRFALIGCGAISRTNAEAIATSSFNELALVMDAREDAARSFSSRYGVPYTTDVAAVFSDSSVDAVLIAVPHHLHCELALAAAAAGKHVLVEKPIALTVDEASRMMKACREAGVYLSVFLPMRYSPAIRMARRFVAEGGLGEVLGSELVMLRDRSESFQLRDTWLEGFPNWRGDKSKSGGGILMDNLPHYLDYFYYIMGLEIREVVGSERTGLLPVDVEDTAAVICRYHNGALGTITLSSAVRGAGTEEKRVIDNTAQKIWGSHGQLILYPHLQFYSRKRIDGRAPHRWHGRRLKPAAGLSERRLFVDRFGRSVLAGEPPEVGGREGLRVSAVIEAIYLSSRTRGWTQVQTIKDDHDR